MYTILSLILFSFLVMCVSVVMVIHILRPMENINKRILVNSHRRFLLQGRKTSALTLRKLYLKKLGCSPSTDKIQGLHQHCNNKFDVILTVHLR